MPYSKKSLGSVQSFGRRPQLRDIVGNWRHKLHSGNYLGIVERLDNMSILQPEKAGDLNPRENPRSLYTGISIFYTFERENLTFPKAKLTRGLASTTGLAENIAILGTGSGFRV
jgi:hypothetical protein